MFDQVEAARVPALVDEIKAGATVLVVSDAGMPLISDPGYRMVVACVQAGVPVSCLPGPSAVITALAVSGLPAEKFCFEGFAPRKSGARKTWLASLADERRTCVFFESPRRLAACLLDAVDQLGGSAPGGDLPGADQGARGSGARIARGTRGVGGRRRARRNHGRAGRREPARRCAVAGRPGSHEPRRRGGSRQGRLHRGGRGPSRRALAPAVRRGAAVAAARINPPSTDPSSGRGARQPDDGSGLVQAFRPFGIGVGIGGDPAADAQHGASGGVELHGADRDIQLAPGDR